MADLFQRENIDFTTTEQGVVDLFERENISFKPTIEKTDRGVVIPAQTTGDDVRFLSSPEQLRSWRNKGPIGVWDYAQMTHGSDLYFGSVFGVASFKGLVDRIQKDEYLNDQTRGKDVEALEGIMRKKEEIEARGYTMGTNIYKVVANIPAFAGLMWATRNPAASFRATVGGALAKGAVKKTLLRKGAEVLAREAVVAAGRTAILPHTYAASYMERNINDTLSITDKGIQILKESEKNPYVTALKSFGDPFVEFYTEEFGGQVFKPLGKAVGKGILSRMPMATKTAFKKTALAFARKIPKGKFINLLSKGGFDGLLEEYGEERVGSLLRVPLGLDERDIPTMDKLYQAIFPGWEQAAIEFGAFGIWGGMGASAQVISNKLSGRGRSKEEIDKILKNLSETEKDKFASTLLAQDFEEEIARAELVVKASAGGELTVDEQARLDSIYTQFVEEGLIEGKEEATDVEKAQGIVESQIVEPEAIPQGKEGIVEGEAKEFKGRKIEQVRVEDTPERARAIGVPKDEFDALSKDIQEKGVVQPIIIDKESGQVLDGHHRLFVAEELGIESVPVVYVDKNEFTREEFDEFIKPEAKSAEETLIQQAKKFKTAEEFFFDKVGKGENEVIYHQIGNNNIEIIKNPTPRDISQMTNEFKKEFPEGKGEPAIRTTYDDKGNKYIFRSDKSTHGDIEPFLRDKFGVYASQDQWTGKKYLTDIWNKAQEVTPAEVPKTKKAVKDVLDTKLEKEIQAFEEKEGERISLQDKARIELKNIESTLKAIRETPEFSTQGENIFEGKQELIKDLIEQKKMQQERIKELKPETVTMKETTFLKKRIADIQSGIRQGTTEVKKAIKEIQDRAIKILSDKNLDTADKGKFIKTIKSIQTESQLEKAIPLIEERISKIQEKRLRKRLTKTVLKQPKKPEGVVDVKYQKKINAILEKLGAKKKERRKSLTAMSTKELEETANEIASLKDIGRKVFKSKKAQREMAAEIIRAILIKEAGGMPDGTFAKGSAEERKQKRAGGIKKADIAFTRPLAMIKRLFGDAGERLIYNAIDQADTIKGVFSLSRKIAIDESMKKHKVKLFDLGSSITINGKTYQVNNILRMYLALKDEQSKAALLGGHNLTEGEVNEFVDVVRKEMPSYIDFADDVQKTVAERYPQIAETMETFFNVPVEKVEVYFPLKRIALGTSQEELNQDIESEMVFEQALRKGEGFVYTSTSKGFTISRKDIDEKFQSEISLNFLGDAYTAIDKQEHLIAYAPLHKAFNKIINDKNLQDAVKYNHSDAAWKWLNDYLLRNVNPDLMYSGMSQYGGIINTVLKKARKGLSKAFLGFNVITAGKQFPSAELALKYTTQKDLLVSMGRILMSKEARDRVYELDPSLKNRIISRDFNDLLKVITSLPDSDIKRRLLVMSKTIDKASFTMILQMDKYAVLSVYDAVYRHQLKTKSETEAKDIAHKAVIRTQPVGGMKDLPEIYTTNNEFLRMSLMFSNQLNQIWNMIRSDLPTEIKQKQYGMASKGIASIMVSSTLIYIMSHGRLPEDWDDFIEAIFGNVMASVPIAGQWGMAMVRGYEPSISPGTSILNNMKWMISNIKNEDYVKALEKALFLLAVWAEMPYSQFKRTIDGIHDLSTRETNDFRRLIWSEFILEKE